MATSPRPPVIQKSDQALKVSSKSNKVDLIALATNIHPTSPAATSPLVVSASPSAGTPPVNAARKESSRGVITDTSFNLEEEDAQETPEDRLIMLIQKEPYYHGHIELSEMDCLRVPGDFAVRIPEKERGILELVIFWGTEIRRCPFIFLKCGTEQKERLVTLNGMFVKPSIAELIDEHVKQSIPIKDNMMLKRAIARPIWELNPDSVFCDKKIGEGAFGSVWKGTLKNDTKDGIKEIAVAIKVTKVSEENKAKMAEMLFEARLMRNLNHCNVVAFYGVVNMNNQIMIVMEYVNGGSMELFLRKSSTLTIEDKCTLLFDIASGMQYLHSTNTIHRDVAARNVLVDNINFMGKISDFGMSKRTDHSYKCAATDRIPIRWQAPEVLRTGFHSKECDVFSYGMVIYEVFSNGKVPHEGIDVKVIRQKIHEPKFRPLLPPETPKNIQKLYKMCVAAHPNQRPSFTFAVRAFYPLTKNRKCSLPPIPPAMFEEEVKSQQGNQNHTQTPSLVKTRSRSSSATAPRSILHMTTYKFRKSAMGSRKSQ